MTRGLFFLTASLALCVLGSAAFAQTPAPPAATIVPSLPEIGRVRAVSPLCAVVRDIALPSFDSARHADAQFFAAASKLPDYVKTLDEESRWHMGGTQAYNDPRVAWYRHMIGQYVVHMAVSITDMEKKLGDPRIANATDDDTVALRNSLDEMAAVQRGRVNILEEYIMRQEMTAGRSLADKMRQNTTGAAPTQPDGRPTPLLDYLPSMNGNPERDHQIMREWTGALAGAVGETESASVKVVAGIAERCR